jgi:DNA-binding transcriptional LysR family regulator
MELRTLRVFVEVVRQGGFSRAAEIVFATQSTVSKAVKQLEDEIGVPLLDRVGHRSVLTVAGEIVYRRALKMLAERDDLVAELDDLRGLRRGTLRLGLPPMGSSLFAPLFVTFRDRYPGVDVRLVEHGSARLQEILLAGEIDLAASLLPVSDEFEWQEVRSEPLMALVPGDHPLAHKRTVSLLDLKEIPFILFDTGFALTRIIVEACQRHGFEPTVAARTSQIAFAVELAALGLGVAILPRITAERLHYPSVCRILLDEPGVKWQAVMIWRRGAHLSHSARAWLAIWRETYPDQPAVEPTTQGSARRFRGGDRPSPTRTRAI